MMRQHLVLFAVSLSILVVIPAAVVSPAAGVKGDWRLGRIYYRLVCNACHKKEIGQAISPSEYTAAEWNAIIDNEKHAPAGNANPSIRYYVSRGYREWVKRDNRAAEKFLEIPEQELLNDVRLFVLQGAKDSDTPVRCK